ncbi:MAG: hypothetical protein ACFCUO_00100 [Rhodospirillales bacterium]
MFEDVLRLIVELERRRPAPTQPAALDELFRRLAATPPAADAYAIEDRIWETWIDHPDPAAAAAMGAAIAAIAARRDDEARPLLDDLVRRQPLWAEAWNKRATLHFLCRRDAESAADIRRTLELEPRHFGALAGFARICLRHGETAAALVAFQAALAVNPHAAMIRIAVEELARRPGPTLH